MGQYKKILFLVLTLSLILVFMTSCSHFGITMGSGKVITEEREVSGFDSISIGSSMNLLIEQTGIESLKLEAEDNIIPLIKTDVSGNQLNIRLDSVSLGIVKPINCYVTVKDLKGLRISSSSSAVSKKLTIDKLDIDVSSSARGELVVDADEINVGLSSSSKLVLSGETNKQNIKVSSSAVYMAKDLKSKECTVDAASSSSATVNVSDLLIANISSSARVNYIGKPEIRPQISSSGSLNNITE